MTAITRRPNRAAALAVSIALALVPMVPAGAGRASTAGAAASPESTVVSVADAAGYRQALSDLSALAGAGANRIEVTADFAMSGSAWPIYDGSRSLTVDGNGHRVDGGTAERPFLRVEGGPTVKVLDLTLMGFRGSAITATADAADRWGRLVVRRSRFTGNSTSGRGGAISAAFVEIGQSTFDENHSIGAGGAVHAQYRLGAARSTFTGNSSGTGGAALHSTGGLDLSASTVVDNSSPNASVRVRDSLIAGGSVVANPLGGGVACAVGASNDHGSLASDPSCGFDVVDPADPGLGALADNGGPTPTRMPAPGSPLVDAGPGGDPLSDLFCYPADQRGVRRPVAGACDLGAVERGWGAVVTTGADAGPGSYRQAVTDASAAPWPVRIDLDEQRVSLTGGDVVYSGDQPIEVRGVPGAGIDGGGGGQILRATVSPSVSVVDLVLQHGVSDDSGGAVEVEAAGGALTIERSALLDNVADVYGGGAGSQGTLTLRNSTVSGNEAGIGGGGVASAGTMTLEHATVTDNTSGVGANAAGFGALHSFGSVLAEANGPSNCSFPEAPVSEGYNYSTDTTCNPGTGTDVTGGADPRLGPVRDNGRATPTRFPLAGSPLVDAIPVDECREPFDQRQLDRPFPIEGPCDIGAIEAVYPEHHFTDVPGKYDAAVRWVSSHVNDPALMDPYAGGAFLPRLVLTRGKLALTLYRQAGTPDVSSLPPVAFTDVPAAQQDAVRWAVGTSILAPRTPTVFGAGDPSTRVQVAVALYRVAGSQDVTSFPPHGLDDVPAWADDAVTWAVHHGVMVGSDGSFNPREPVSRGPFARFDYRLAIDPAAWADPSVAPSTVPFRPSP
ncbi:MAG: S-layer homology domain-containing protein [Acidimicrobiales bacterium]|nr:S-layer homology domain-containing protein [Acidimicrobiales bacterium]